MNIYIKITESGHLVRVFDRIVNVDVFNGFLDAGTPPEPIEIASNDGVTGNIDIYKGLHYPANTISKTDYSPKVDEIILISDGQD